MKKVMIIGKFNPGTKEIYNGLTKYNVIPFQVQLCLNSMEWVKPLMQMTDPELVVMCLNGVEKGDMQIASELRINYMRTPILCCGTEMELIPFQKFLSTKQFEKMQRPFDSDDVAKKVKEILQLEGPDVPSVKDLLNYSEEEATSDYAPQDPDWNIDFDQAEIDRRIAEAMQRKQREQEQWIQQAQTAPVQPVPPQSAAQESPYPQGTNPQPQPQQTVLQPAMQGAGVQADGDPNGRRHILLVDDNAIQLRALRSVLVQEYDISLAVSGEDAMTQMEKRHPDMIFLDYEMPGSNGRDVLSRIRQMGWAKNLPVVFLTGLRDKDKIRELVALKPAGYMLKPADADSVKQMIKKILG